MLYQLEEQRIYQFSQEEVQYLTYVIVGSGLRFFMKNETIPLVFREKIRQLIQKVSRGIQIDLTQDSRLEEDLLLHLYQLLLRIEAQTTIVNPLIDEIKQNYPSLYGVVWFALNDFRWPYQVSLSEDEVGFVAIHFQAAIERVKRLNRLLFVCPNGMGTSSFVSAKIRRILPDIDSIETASVDKLNRLDLFDVDLIISTVDIPKQIRPVVRISPMVTARDMKRIMNHYIDLVIDNEQINIEGSIAEKVKTLISSNVYFDHFDSKEAAIRFLVDQQQFENEDSKQRFLHSIFEREEIQSTYLENGFAIPHGNPNVVKQTSVAVLIADKPFSWGYQKADIVVLLMIREEDVKAVEIASNPLLKNKMITHTYLENMIRSVEENGPYMVLADYFALMHAKPGLGVNEQSMSLLVVKDAVDMKGKPIHIFLVLAAKNHESHLERLKDIMEIFMDNEKYQTILSGNKETIIQLFA